MARTAATRIRDAQQVGDEIGESMALESFLVHARNLRDFFARNGRDNDVLARDFLGRLASVRLPFLRRTATRHRLDRRIAHISYSRSKLKRDWPVTTILNELDAAMAKFERELRAASPRLADSLVVATGASI
jgi:hypothetical protein